ncbi:hypothetical protein, partial [Sinorhizobium meliloti]|uniref:hypothetical protein n=1 Tax=Rhizobium meliloti TaxID=382 RepID=UPI001AECCEB3
SLPIRLLLQECCCYFTEKLRSPLENASPVLHIRDLRFVESMSPQAPHRGRLSEATGGHKGALTSCCATQMRDLRIGEGQTAFGDLPLQHEADIAGKGP